MQSAENMHLRKNIAHNLIRISCKLKAAGKHMAAPGCPGTISVAGKIVTDLTPQGAYRQPGITKVGRLSFSGVCEERKVKLYSVHSPKQAKLRIAIENTELGVHYFPKVIAHDRKYIVEEWISGLTFNQLKRAHREMAQDEIKHFFLQCAESQELLQLAAKYRDSFCYFRDYLLKRLQPWHALDYVREFLDFWHDSFHAVKAHIPLRLSHPDISLANILMEKKTNRLVVIDNELLGVGRGWILDTKNSLLNEFAPIALDNPTSQAIMGFLKLSWQLRQLGSLLDAGNFENAYSTAVLRSFEF